jgi:hypothetical protein
VSISQNISQLFELFFKGLPIPFGFHIWTMITWLSLVSLVLRLDVMM